MSGATSRAQRLYDGKGMMVLPPQKLTVQLVGRKPAIHNGEGSVVATVYDVKCTVDDEDVHLAECEFSYWFKDRQTGEKLYYSGNERRNTIVVREGGCVWVQARRFGRDPYAVTDWGPEVRVTPDSLGTPTHRNY